MCGLKHTNPRIGLVGYEVTPCMGVWIETAWNILGNSAWKSHPVWVCGLKLMSEGADNANSLSHPVWVCGLKHDLCVCNPDGSYVTPCMGVWIETLAQLVRAVVTLVTPCMGVWIETRRAGKRLERSTVTPCMGVWIETRNISRLK